MRIQDKNNKTRKVRMTLLVTSVLVGIAILCAIIVAVIGYNSNNDTIKRDKNSISTERTPQDIALEKNLEESPEKKQDRTQTDVPVEPEVDSTTNLQEVNVVLTSVGEASGKVSASGFVSNTVESEGVCTYVFTKGNSEIIKTSSVLANASSTTCKTVEFNASELSSGSWSVKLRYSSSISAGLSNNTLSVLIP